MQKFVSFVAVLTVAILAVNGMPKPPKFMKELLSNAETRENAKQCLEAFKGSKEVMKEATTACITELNLTAENKREIKELVKSNVELRKCIITKRELLNADGTGISIDLLRERLLTYVTDSPIAAFATTGINDCPETVDDFEPKPFMKCVMITCAQAGVLPTA